MDGIVLTTTKWRILRIAEWRRKVHCTSIAWCSGANSVNWLEHNNIICSTTTTTTITRGGGKALRRRPRWLLGSLDGVGVALAPYGSNSELNMNLGWSGCEAEWLMALVVHAKCIQAGVFIVGTCTRDQSRL